MTPSTPLYRTPGAIGSGAARLSAALFVGIVLLTAGCKHDANDAASKAPSTASTAGAGALPSAAENKARGMAAIDANSSMPEAQKQALKAQLGKMGTKP